MTCFNSRKKFFFSLFLILLISSLGIFVLGAKDAQAESWAVNKFVKGILIAIGYVSLTILQLTGYLLSVTAKLATSLLGWSDFINATIVETGWKITRDLANMFFVLILLVISFATILQINAYGIKTLLPKLIIAALLINFSLVIAGSIIDFSQVMTDFFIEGSGGTDFTVTIANALGLSKINPSKKVCLNYDYLTIECTSYGNKEYDWNGDNKDIINIIIGLIMAIVFSVVALFVFAAFVFFLVVRIVMLWLLLILSPLVWMFWILPATQKQWTDWWHSFIKWAFFAPIYCFFLFLALTTFQGFLTEGIAGALQEGDRPNTLLPSLLDSKNLVQYLFVVGVLFGGLIIAQKMSVYGAHGAMDMAKRTGKWARNLTLRPPRALGEKMGAGAMKLGGKGIQKIGLKSAQKLGRRMEARATMIKRSPEERDEHKKYAQLLNSMSPQDVLKEAKTARGVRGLIAAKKAQGLKEFRTTENTEQVRAVMSRLKTFNATEELSKAEEIRPDAIPVSEHQEEVTQKIIQEGNLNKLPPAALQDERLVATIAKFAKPGQIESLGSVSPQHKKGLTDVLKKLTDTANTDEMAKRGIINIPDNKEIQQAYASQTGDVSRMSAPQKINWAETAGPEGLKRMDSFDPTIAVHIPSNQLKITLEKMENSATASDTAQHIRTTPRAPANQLAKEDPWIKNL